MNEASFKQKIILAVDVLILLLCVTGVYQISEKSKLPFEIHSGGSALIIKSDPNSPYYILNGAELISVGNINVNTPEEIELITDTKNIGEQIEITFRLVTSLQKMKVTLTEFYSIWYLMTISFTSLLFFLAALFMIVRKPNDTAAEIFHWASIGIACIIDLTWASNTKSVIIPYFISRIPFHFSYSFVPLLFVHFTFVFPNKRNRLFFYFIIPAYVCVNKSFFRIQYNFK